MKDTEREYQIHLEKRLIQQFKQNFFEKVGYYPVVLTETKMEGGSSDDYLPLMGLEVLKSYFDPYLPEKYGKIVPLNSKRRYREVVELRCIFAFLAKNMKYTFKSIGFFLGGRDHTTAIHAINTFNDLIETDPMFRHKYLVILEDIKSTHKPYKDEPSIVDNNIEVQCNTEPDLSA